MIIAIPLNGLPVPSKKSLIGSWLNSELEGPFCIFTNNEKFEEYMKDTGWADEYVYIEITPNQDKVNIKPFKVNTKFNRKYLV